MKNSNFFETEKFGYDENQSETYFGMMRSIGVMEGLTTLFTKQTLAAGVASFIFFGLYGVPLFLLFAFFGRAIGHLIVRIVYAVLGTSRKVRWTTNSLINYVFHVWLWIWFGGCIVFVVSMVLTPPALIYQIITMPPTYGIDIGSSEYNVFMRWVGQVIFEVDGLGDFLYRWFVWDNNHPIMSMIKTLISFSLGQMLTYRAHQHVSEEQFLEDEGTSRDGWLLYEKIGRNNSVATLLFKMAKDL